MSKYVVGIDGGGTKTTAKIIFHNGRPPVLLTGGPLNICSASKEQVAKTINDLVARIEEKAGPLAGCAGICIGAAGYSNPEAGPFLKRCMQNSSGCGNVIVTSDAYIGLCGALEASQGVILIAGTGSVCHGINSRGESWRTGGAGHLIDDEGSGYAIGRDILSAAVRSFDGRGEPTILVRLLKEHKAIACLEDIVAFTYDGAADKSLIASVAPILTYACDAKDPAALKIASHAAQELQHMAATVIDHLGLSAGAIALRGSILQKDLYIAKLLTNGLKSRYPSLNIVSSGGEAADGAAFLASQTDLTGLPVFF